jgi:hypothetical protein
MKKLLRSLFALQHFKYISLIILSVFYGVYAQQHHHTIAVIIEDALKTHITAFQKPWYFIETSANKTIQQYNTKTTQVGLNKVVHFSGEKTLAVSIIESNGTLVHQWQLDWFELWPDASHLSYFMKPKSQPGTMIHGAEILPNGDLVFNFEYLGMIRINMCGDVVWRLPFQTHHSIFIDEQEFIWVGVNKVRKNDTLKQAFHQPYYIEPFIFTLTRDGTIIEQKSVFDILNDNHLSAALYLSSIDNEDPIVKGDTLHLNDIEIFPSTMKFGFFQAGDIMISLRNINMIIIVEPSTWKLKHVISNLTLRQHDPDFIDGNTISVYDNNNQFSKNDNNAFSQIVRISVPDNTVTPLFKGNEKIPFYSKILGKQQQLANGNLLITDSRNGKAIEVNSNNELVWEFINVIDKNTAAVIQEVERLPIEMDKSFFGLWKDNCERQRSLQ